MRKSNWTPSIVPNGADVTVYLVAEDLGRLGRIWREADYEATDLETVLQDLLEGQYSNPVRVIGFNTAERWSEDAPRRRRSRAPPTLRPSNAGRPAVQGFVERHEGDRRQLTLHLT